MAAAAPLVSIITINYNQPEVTRDLLVSLRGSDYDRVEVIVVDNGSVDDPIPALRRDFPEVQFIRSEANLGFSGGNNLGILASRGDFLFFVNNDTELEADTITRLLATYADRPRLGALSPLILYHPEVVEGQRDLIQYAGTTPLTAYTARNRTLGERQRNRGHGPRRTQCTRRARYRLCPRARLQRTRGHRIRPDRLARVRWLRGARRRGRLRSDWAPATENAAPCCLVRPPAHRAMSVIGRGSGALAAGQHCGLGHMARSRRTGLR